MKALERELETYSKKLPELLSSEGKFVVICGEKIEGIFETYPDALKIGYEKAGMTPFLVKKISGIEQISYFTREIQVPCHI